jgi:phage portal protein BeeE
MEAIVRLFGFDFDWKGFSVSRRPGQELTSVASLMPRTLFDYKSEDKSEVDGYQSAIIMACVRWLQRTYPEAPVMLEKQNPDGAWERINDHPLLMLLDMPNPYYDGLQLTMGLIADYVLSGNAYVLKRRSPAGRVVEYWWTPSTLMEPKWPRWQRVSVPL